MVYVHLATGFEEVEALTIVDILRRAGISIETVSITGAYEVMGAHGIKVTADILYGDADYNACEMIVLPGGMPGASNLQEHEGLESRIKAFAAEDKKLAAICAAPMVLDAHGVLQGKKAVIYPGMEGSISSAKPVKHGVVKDGNIITGKGPAHAMEFALALVEELSGKVKAADVAKGLLYKRWIDGLYQS